MIPALVWYVLVGLLGLLSFPLAYRLLRALPDRGYAFARALGLLIWGLAFWLLGSYEVLGNNSAGLLAALLVLGLLAYWAWRGLAPGELRAWLTANRGYIVKAELLFLLAFAAMTLYRAALPQATSTEKPMELAFINSILASPAMPPNDPWLSGYSISYYYFGYVLVSMLAMASNIGGAVAFNLGLALVFALTALGAYGLVYNLLALRSPGKAQRSSWLALMAPVFVLVFGNLEGVLEVIHAQHWLGPWLPNEEGVLQARFWSWLDIKDLVFAPAGDPSWTPRNFGTNYWWWWRASRVINDVNFLGIQQELIDEFPAFSFVLGDLHPHVLSMPFVFLAMGGALNLYRGGALEEGQPPFWGLYLSPIHFALSAVVLGGLAFLNIWDFPIYLILFAAAYALRQARQQGWAWARLGDFFSFVLVLGLAGLLLYLPFFIGFSSQAGGILPNLLNPTRGAHLWVMFGTLFPFIFLYLLHQIRAGDRLRRAARGLVLALALVTALWLLSLGAAWLLGTLLTGTALGDALLSGLGAPDLSTLLAESISRRLVAIGGLLTMTLLLGLILGRLWPSSQKARPKGSGRGSFVLVLALGATLLVIAPEFVYLRDHFGTRMNTVFKFYIQAWLMFGVVAAYGAAMLLVKLQRVKGMLFSVFLVFLVGLALIFPAFAFSDRVISHRGRPPSLDGAIQLSAAQREAVDWLDQQPIGVLAEAVGGQYSAYARYATYTGHMGVLGWPGHEGQWRGGSVDYGPRIGDVETLYTTQDWLTALNILDQYEVKYIIVGDLEHSAYTVSEEKFLTHLPLAFQNAEVIIYLVP